MSPRCLTEALDQKHQHETRRTSEYHRPSRLAVFDVGQKLSGSGSEYYACGEVLNSTAEGWGWPSPDSHGGAQHDGDCRN